MADIEDLQAAFEQIVAAMGRRDAAAYSSHWHEQLVVFPPFSPFPIDDKAALRPLVDANFANSESVSFSPLNPQCRVIGRGWSGGIRPCRSSPQRGR
jgi:ketosteroid isomerase-like protein